MGEINEKNLLNSYISNHGNQFVKSTDRVAIYFVAKGKTVARAEQLANHWFFTFAPVQALFAKLGSNLIARYNADVVRHIQVGSNNKVTLVATKVLSPDQLKGLQVLDNDDKTLVKLVAPYLDTLLSSEEDLKEVLKNVRKGDASSPRIGFLAKLARSDNPKKLLEQQRAARQFVEESEEPVDVYLNDVDWNTEIHKLLKTKAPSLPDALTDRVQFIKSEADIGLWKDLISIGTWLQEVRDNNDTQHADQAVKHLGKIEIRELSVFIKEYVSPYNEMYKKIIESKIDDPGLKNSVANILIERDLIATVSDTAVNGLVSALRELKGLQIGPQEIVAGFKDYLDECAIKEVDPFDKERLKGLEARIINPTNFIRDPVSIVSNMQGWNKGLHALAGNVGTQKGALISEFIAQFGAQVPYPSKTVGWEPGDAQKLLFEKVVDFAKKNPTISPQAVVQAFRQEVLSMADAIEAKEHFSAFYLKDEIVPKLKQDNLAKRALYAEIEVIFAKQGVLKDQLPVFVESLFPRLGFSLPLSDDARKVVEFLGKLLANPDLTVLEKRRKLEAMPQNLLNLQKNFNVKNRIAAIEIAFNAPTEKPIDMQRLLNVFEHSPEAVIMPAVHCLQAFYVNPSGARRVGDETINEIVRALKENKGLQEALQSNLKKIPALLSGGTDLVKIQSEKAIQLDIAPLANKLGAAIEEYDRRTSKDEVVNELMKQIVDFAVEFKSDREVYDTFVQDWKKLEKVLNLPLIRSIFTVKGINRLGKVVTALSTPINFIVNKILDKMIARAAVYGNTKQVNNYESMKKMVKPALALVCDLLPGIVQRHPFFRFGEHEPNILGAVKVFLDAIKDPHFTVDPALQDKMIANLKPFLKEFVSELSPYSPLVNDLIASVLKLGQ